MTNPLDAINDFVNKATQAPSQLRWLMCRECGNVLEHDMATIPPADPCVGCNAPFNRVTLPSRELAEQKRRELRKEKGLLLSPADLAALQRDSVAPVPPVAAAPVPPAPAAPEKVESAAPVAAPAETPKPKRGRASKATEAAKVPEAPVAATPEPQTASAPILTPMPEAPADLFPQDAMTSEQWAQKREEEKRTFIEKLQLTHTAWTPCGHGRLFSTGFWSEREDGTRFIDWCEIHDTPASFAARYNEAKMRDSRTTADQGLINDLSADLKLVAFRGTVTASLRQVLQSCSIRPTYGCRVSLAARLTESGNISFQVTAVSK